jgi:uncharacterized protein
MIEKKKEKLLSFLQELGSFVVAFSGGVDSSFLLYTAHSLKNIRMIGITIRTPYIPDSEIKEAVEFSKSHGIKQSIIDLPFPEVIRNNPADRCYICKKILFTELLEFAGNNGYRFVVEGTNADDINAYRPGMKALAELKVKSPLLEAGLTKKDIRELSEKEGLPTWDKPAKACLLTRIPYNTRITAEMVKMIDEAEHFLYEMGYPGVRVRLHGDLARIECIPDIFGKIIHNPDKELIINKFKKIGFRYISLDLEGYRSGSADQEIKSI